MTWSYINQLVSEAVVARKTVRRKGFGSLLRPSDLVILTSLASDTARHRFFVSGIEDAGLLKDEPLAVQELCPIFDLPGSHAKASDFALLRPSRQFLASLVFPAIATRSIGAYRFFVCALATYRLIMQTLFKTRRLTFIRIRFYNRQRRRAYLWRPEQFNLVVDKVGYSLGALVVNRLSNFLYSLRVPLWYVGYSFFAVFMCLLV